MSFLTALEVPRSAVRAVRAYQRMSPAEQRDMLDQSAIYQYSGFADEADGDLESEVDWGDISGESEDEVRLDERNQKPYSIT